MFNLKKCFQINPILKRNEPNHYSQPFNFMWKLEYSDLYHFWGDGTKLKRPSEIEPTLPGKLGEKWSIPFIMGLYLDMTPSSSYLWSRGSGQDLFGFISG